METPPLTPPSPEFLAQRETRLTELRATLDASIGSHASIILEIGCGHGHFLTALAATRPDSLHLGIDLIPDRIKRAERKRDRAHLSNLAFVRGEAAEVIASLPPKVRLEDTYILFPDPWPKRRHHKNRLIQPDFLSELAARSAPHARLSFRTDHEPYFKEAFNTILSHSKWSVDEHAAWPFELSTVFQQRAATYFSLVATARI